MGLLLAIGASASAHAQSPAQFPPTPAFASPFLPANHWAVQAVRRLNALGLTDRRFGWLEGSLSRREVGAALQSAVRTAQRTRPEFAALTLGYWQRFLDEFPVTADALVRRTIPTTQAEGWFTLGYARETGHLLPVRSRDNSRDNVDPPTPLGTRSDAGLDLGLGIPLGRYAVANFAPQRTEGRWGLGDSYLMGSWKKVGVWLGQRSFAYGPGNGGGIVFDGTTPFLGGGVSLMEPIRLPWIFRYIGPINFETFLSRIDSSASVKHPWVVASHGSFSPFPRLLLGFTQAFMFSGSGLPPFNWPNFKEMFHSHGATVTGGREFENGIASGEVRFRAPTPVVPTTFYLEWGAEDNHKAWVLFPATVAGVQVPAVPGVPALSLGFEHAFFHRPCTDCNYYATWYRHYVFKDGWTVNRTLIGHPLGGEGEAWRLYGSWDDPARRWRLNAATFLRDRGQFNLFSPTHQGRSTGGELNATYRAAADLDVVLDGALEVGHADWTESSVFGGFRWLF